QAIDEPDRIGDQQLAAVGQAYLPYKRVERHEQRVRRFRLRLRQHVEEGRLAGIGVADERHRRDRRLVAALAKLRAPPPDLLDVRADDVNARPDAAAIGLELGFSRTARADAAAEPRQRVAGAD